MQLNELNSCLIHTIGHHNIYISFLPTRLKLEPTISIISRYIYDSTWIVAAFPFQFRATTTSWLEQALHINFIKKREIKIENEHKKILKKRLIV